MCELTDASNPGPRKEMLWAQWGLRDRLMGDVDPWLCHQCGDCTLRCPRGARPGDVMAALRRECVIHYATPRAFGRWRTSAASRRPRTGTDTELLSPERIIASVSSARAFR